MIISDELEQPISLHHLVSWHNFVFQASKKFHNKSPNLYSKSHKAYRNLICYLVKSWWSMSIPAFFGASLKGLGKKQCPIYEWFIHLNQIFLMNWLDSVRNLHRLHFMNYTEMILVHCDSLFWSNSSMGMTISE